MMLLLLPAQLLNFYDLLITFANSMDPDQDRLKVFDALIAFLKEFFEKVNFEKSQQTTTKMLTLKVPRKNASENVVC